LNGEECFDPKIFPYRIASHMKNRKRHLSMARVLVTGGSGYIGSHACKLLARAGHRPIVYDDLRRGNKWAVRWGPLVAGDLLDHNLLARTFEEYRPEAVLHFAGCAYVGESVTDPEHYYRNNVAATLSLLGIMKDHEVRSIIFSSTCATYGVPESLPIDENHPQSPVNPYGTSKLIVERMLRDFAAAYGIQSIILRFFNAAGADPDGELGEAHDPETHAVPLVIQAALGTGPAFRIFGTDYDTPDGTAVRDYIHVSDLASAHVLAVDRILSGVKSEVFNLGTGTSVSVKQLIDAVERIGGRRVPVEPCPRRQGDPPILVADAGKAGRVLRWTPRFSSIDSIVETAWRWHQKAISGDSRTLTLQKYPPSSRLHA
jgi:UDP-arabinose 4-epimerase